MIRVFGLFVADDEQDPQTKSLRLHQTLDREDRPAAAPLLHQRPIGRGRESRKLEILQIDRILRQCALEMGQGRCQLFRPRVNHRPELRRMRKAEVPAQLKRQRRAPTARLAEARRRHHDIRLIRGPLLRHMTQLADSLHDLLSNIDRHGGGWAGQIGNAHGFEPRVQRPVEHELRSNWSASDHSFLFLQTLQSKCANGPITQPGRESIGK